MTHYFICTIKEAKRKHATVECDWSARELLIGQKMKIRIISKAQHDNYS